jgi:phosphatidylglycerophosphate synthase
MLDKDKKLSRKEKFRSDWSKFFKDGKECIKEFKDPKTRYKQIPNTLTASRIFSPFFIIPSAFFGNALLTIIFAVSFALTDAFDGKVARKYNVVSEFGKDLDPIVDKVAGGLLLIPLVFVYPIMIINLLLEVLISAINTCSKLDNNKPESSLIGKSKTWLISLTTIFGYIGVTASISPNMISSLVIATGLLQIPTAINYYNQYCNAEKEKKQIMLNNSNQDENEFDKQNEVNNREKSSINLDVSKLQSIEKEKQELYTIRQSLTGDVKPINECEKQLDQPKVNIIKK